MSESKNRSSFMSTTEMEHSLEAAGVNMRVSESEIRKLKCLYVFMDPSKAHASDLEYGEELRNLLRRLNSLSQIYGVYHQRRYPHTVKTRFADLPPRLSHLIRECVAYHQWPEALQLVKALVRERYENADTTVYRVGLAALYQVTEDRTRLMGQFVKQVSYLKNIVSVEAELDHLSYLLGQGSLEEAKDFIQETKRVNYYPSQIITDKRRQAQTLLKGYQGLILFIEWKRMIHREDEKMEEDIISQMMSQGMSTQLAKTTADSALEILAQFKDKADYGDVFVSNVLEICSYYDQDPRDILEVFRENNPQNPNAHKLMFQLETQQSASVEVQLETLKPLLELDPCNPLAIYMVKVLGPESPIAVEFLFDYLDFDHCDNDAEAWSLLAKALKALPDNADLVTAVSTCWETRKDWWPFVKLRADGGNVVPKEIQKSKRKVRKRLEALG